MLKLLMSLRRTYKVWQALPPEQREESADEVRRVLGLVRELGGERAVRMVEDTEDLSDPADEVAVARDRAAVLAELKDASATLSSRLSEPALQCASDAVPRPVAFGGRVIARRFARRS